MRVWRTRFYRKDKGCMLFWFTSRRDAESKLRDLAAEADGPSQGLDDVQPIDIDTRRGELVSWLNVNCANGNAQG